jgi:cyanophycin synthetase
MKIVELKVLRGPNYWSIKKDKLIQMLLDLEDLEFRPTNKIHGFDERLQHLLPSLYEHECSEGVPGGFFIRVKEGTWMGHVIEHIALELQSLAGMQVGFGRTRGAGKEGLYHVAFSYEEEQAGIYTAHAAVKIAEALINGEAYPVEETIREIKRLWINGKLGPSTGSLVEEARKRNIPFLRLDDGSLIQLGYGARQKRIEASITSNTSSIAVDIAGNKDQTKNILTAANIPVPEGCVIEHVDNLKQAIEAVGFPIVIKPLNGNQGKGATINIHNWQAAACAFHRAQKISAKVLVEKFVEGKDFRVLVVNNKFVAAALRTPACITGDNVHTIRELIEIENGNPKRGICHENLLTRIRIDDETNELLALSNYTLDTILPLQKTCYLKRTANLSTGGTAADITDEVHPANIALFERAARIIGLDVCGIDVMAPDLSTPIEENGGVILEVNAAPGLRMHLEPSSGQKRNVAEPIIDMLFDGSGRIPIVAVTGTNGKTTTTRLVAHIARHAGHATGYTTTDGIYVNNELLVTGDCSGPQSAQFILRDPKVEFAVLETARGGILRSGLGFDQCSCAIVTNVAEDHLGLDGIDTLEKLARVKSVVPETVSETGYAILNADDDLVYAMKDSLKCQVALFSLYSDNIRIQRHCEQGGVAAVLENGFLLLRAGNHIIPIEEVTNVPVTFSGKAEFNIANALAACLAAFTNGIKVSSIREALKTFVPSSENTPGRINIFEFNDFTVLLDYAHNPHGVKALGKLIKSFEAEVKTGIITGVGDRRDEDIIALGEEAARIFDEIIIRHDDDMRGRTVEEIESLLSKGISRVNPNIPVICSMDECEAVYYAIDNAKPQSLIVVLIDKVKKITECIKERQKQQTMQLKKAV